MVLGKGKHIVLLLVALVVGLTHSSAQFTIRRSQPQREEAKVPTLLETLSESRITSQLTNDYYDHAAWVAERNRIRKERNLFELEGSFQTSALQFENWTAGGDNTFSGLATLFMHHRYKHNKFTHDVSINARYGINYIDKTPFKNVDEVKISEVMSWSIRNSWSYSATINFRTQLTDGFQSRTDQTLISTLLSPGFFDISVGFTYAPNGAPYKITLSPIAGNMISMLDERLYMQGLNGVPAGEKVFSAIGPSLNASFDKKFWADKMRYRSTLYIFSDLTSPPTCRWDNWFDVNLSKYLSIKLYGVIYYLQSASPRAQYQYSATVGLSYKFRNK
ncbi:MAG: DUF3078 domain-containing protein [Tidjanibacter sp.]|nr:DUF3078 domain-containing protein [Tidjanibacter sp.]